MINLLLKLQSKDLAFGIFFFFGFQFCYSVDGVSLNCLNISFGVEQLYGEIIASMVLFECLDSFSLRNSVLRGKFEWQLLTLCHETVQWVLTSVATQVFCCLVHVKFCNPLKAFFVKRWDKFGESRHYNLHKRIIIGREIPGTTIFSFRGIIPLTFLTTFQFLSPKRLYASTLPVSGCNSRFSVLKPCAKVLCSHLLKFPGFFACSSAFVSHLIASLASSHLIISLLSTSTDIVWEKRKSRGPQSVSES